MRDEDLYLGLSVETPVTLVLLLQVLVLVVGRVVGKTKERLLLLLRAGNLERERLDSIEEGRGGTKTI